VDSQFRTKINLWGANKFHYIEKVIKFIMY
jgi:hypothetical protein